MVAPPESPPPPSGTLAGALGGTNPTGGDVASSLPGVDISTTGAVGNQLPTTAPSPICESASCDGPARATLIGILLITVRRP